MEWSIESKKKQFKVWQRSRREDCVEYKSLSKEVKSVVSKTKFKKYDGLETNESEIEVYRLT